MAKVVVEVIEWAEKEAKSFEESEVELDEEIAAEFLLAHILRILGDHLEKQERIENDDEAEDEEVHIAEEIASFAKMLTEVDLLVERVAPTKYSKAMAQFQMELASLLMDSHLDIASKVVDYLMDSFERFQADFKESAEFQYLTFMDGKSEELISLGRRLSQLKLDKLLKECLETTVKEAIFREIDVVADLPFESEDLLISLVLWFNDSVLGFVALVLNGGEKESFFQKVENSRKWNEELLEFLYTAFSSKRIAQIFDLIVDFPESEPAIRDLASALVESHKYAELVEGVQSSLKRRLLVPGATTEIILQIYVSLIKLLRIIDSSGVLLEAVSAPISAYMKRRPDTIRCIVGSLTDESDDVLGLYQELKDSSTTLQDAIDDEENDEDPDNWTPEPRHLLPDNRYVKTLRSHDILSMFVHIYGSRELFVNEFANLLGDKLLTIKDFNADKEIHNVELLKIKFGESALTKCEVMLKDMADSKRVNSLIHQALSKDQLKADLKDGVSEVEQERRKKFGPRSTVTVVSHLFWPKLDDEDFHLPSPIEADFEKFTAEYDTLKARSLKLRKSLGSVNLSLDFNDGSLDFEVTPLQATIIYAFCEKAEFTIDELAEKIGTSAETIKKRTTFWVNNGVLRFSGDSYHIVELASQIGEEVSSAAGIDEPAEEKRSAKEEAELELLEKIESFMSGMLAIHGQMSLDRIHAMFSMVLDEYQTHVQSEQQLAKLLEKLIVKGTLTVAGTSYRLASASE